MSRRNNNNWFERTFDTPDKRAKLHMYMTYAQILSWIMIVIGIILFILIVSEILPV